MSSIVSEIKGGEACGKWHPRRDCVVESGGHLREGAQGDGATLTAMAVHASWVLVVRHGVEGLWFS